MRISAITASIPARLASLAEALESARAQTLRPDEHLVAVDYARRGTARVVTQLALAARNEWVATLEDDDVWYPHHLGTLSRAVREEPGGDIYYPWCKVVGRDWSPNSHFDADRLKRENYIPSVALIRRELIADLGGWRHGVAHGWEDHDFWLRALAAGARFVCVPEVTWEYRFHGYNKTIVGEREAA